MRIFYSNYGDTDLRATVDSNGLAGREVEIQTEHNDHYAGNVIVAGAEELVLLDKVAGEKTIAVWEIFRLRVVA